MGDFHATRSNTKPGAYQFYALPDGFHETNEVVFNELRKSYHYIPLYEFLVSAFPWRHPYVWKCRLKAEFWLLTQGMENICSRDLSVVEAVPVNAAFIAFSIAQFFIFAASALIGFTFDEQKSLRFYVKAQKYNRVATSATLKAIYINKNSATLLACGCIVAAVSGITIAVIFRQLLISTTENSLTVYTRPESLDFKPSSRDLAEITTAEDKDINDFLSISLRYSNPLTTTSHPPQRNKTKNTLKDASEQKIMSNVYRRHTDYYNSGLATLSGMKRKPIGLALIAVVGSQVGISYFESIFETYRRFQLFHSRLRAQFLITFKTPGNIDHIAFKKSLILDSNKDRKKRSAGAGTGYQLQIDPNWHAEPIKEEEEEEEAWINGRLLNCKLHSCVDQTVYENSKSLDSYAQTKVMTDFDFWRYLGGYARFKKSLDFMSQDFVKSINQKMNADSVAKNSQGFKTNYNSSTFKKSSNKPLIMKMRLVNRKPKSYESIKINSVVFIKRPTAQQGSISNSQLFLSTRFSSRIWSNIETVVTKILESIDLQIRQHHLRNARIKNHGLQTQVQVQQKPTSTSTSTCCAFFYQDLRFWMHKRDFNLENNNKNICDVLNPSALQSENSGKPAFLWWWWWQIQAKLLWVLGQLRNVAASLDLGVLLDVKSLVFQTLDRCHDSGARGFGFDYKYCTTAWNSILITVCLVFLRLSYSSEIKQKKKETQREGCAAVSEIEDTVISQALQKEAVEIIRSHQQLLLEEQADADVVISNASKTIAAVVCIPDVDAAPDFANSRPIPVLITYKLHSTTQTRAHTRK